MVVGTLLVGFSEELLTRGLLLHAARNSLSTEFQVALLTSVVFGLVHGVNIFTGQDVTTTIQQVFSAIVSGVAFYLTRRLAGTLVAAMLLHAVYDAALFLQGEVQAPADGAGGTGQITQILSLVLQISVVVALVMLWLRSRSKGGTAAA